MEKEYKKISINNLLALAHILDDYEKFNKKLKKFNGNTDLDNLQNLFKVSKGDLILSPRTNKFYKENKNVIDTINKYSTLYDFVNNIYISNCSSYDINYFYNYLTINKDKLDDIVKVVEKIKELGFREIKFNEEENFKKEEYKLNTSRVKSIIYSIVTDIHFLENMELIPEYENNIIKYKTNGSNYCMVLPYRDNAKGWASDEIILNNLLFDSNKLPNSLKKEDTIDKIIALKEPKKEEITSIRELVNLGVKIFDLEKEYANLKYIVDRLENVKSKEELKKVLSNIKIEIEQLRQINKNEVKENPNVSEEQIEKEKQLYIKSREFQYLDLD